MSIYIFIGAAFIFILFMLWFFLRRKLSPRVKPSPYIESLHLLLEGKRTEALEWLKKTVKEDTENIMAYVKLGDILREEGFAGRAVKIHRNLLVRDNLSETEIDMILHHLILDYQASHLIDKAIEMAERLSRRTKKNIKNQQLLLSLYEEKGDWDKTYYLRQSMYKWEKSKQQDILALYKTKAGQNLTKAGNEREGRIRFREALKMDKKCIPAAIYLGDSYRRAERDEDAVKIWKEFIQKNSNWAHIIYPRLNEALFDLGRFGEIEEIYNQVLKKKPKNPTTLLNLAELYKKQGKIEDAIELCEKALELKSDSVRAKYIIVQLLIQKGEETAALEKAIQIIETAHHQEEYICSHCGYKSETLLWYCPGCHEWKTFLND